MKRTTGIAIASAMLALAASFAFRGVWIAAPIWLLVGALWMVGERRGTTSAPVLGLLITVAAAVYGTFERMPIGGLLVAVIAALVAWDGGRMLRQIERAPQVDFASELAQAHQQRLWTVAGLGFLIGLLALVVRVPLGFGWALLLGAIAITGLASALRFFQRESD